MTNEQLIEELLMEASALGIRQEVLDESKKFINQGMSKLEALEAAYTELTEEDDVTWSDLDDDSDIDDENSEELDWSTFTDYPEDEDDFDEWSDDTLDWDEDE